ncbi:MAG: hypothetical protein J6U92_04445 [Clostridia bacterium]|nr:hypothetical protein [Clostridia bacterium]
MNKKIVFIITLVECVLAVLFISVFGQAIFSITKKDVTDIYFVYENGEKIEDGKVVFVLLTDSNRDYRLQWKIEPTDADNPTVGFSVNRPNAVAISPSGVITFFEEGTIIVTIYTTDGSNRSDTLTIKAEEK